MQSRSNPGGRPARRSLPVLIGILCASVAGPARALTTPPGTDLPDSPAAAAFARFLEVLNQGDRGSLQAYVNEAFGAKGREKMPADKRLQWLESVCAASGGYDYQFPAPDEGNHDHRFIAVARNRKSGEWEKVGVEVEPDPPHKLVHAQRRLTALGKLAADVKFTDTMARTVPLRDLRGKIVVLDFWASWCEPCLTLMPELQRLHKDYSDRGVRVIGVNIWEDKAPTHRDPEEFMAVQNYEFELMFLDDAAVPALDVRSLPQMSVLDAEGRYVFITRGSSPGKADLTDLRAALDRELAKSAASVGQE